MREEPRQHEAYAERWGAPTSGVVPLPATRAYTDFLLGTAAVGGLARTCAAMTPCLRLYAFLGSSLAAAGEGLDGPYGEWVRTYADPGFEDLAGRLEALLDRSARTPRTCGADHRRAVGAGAGVLRRGRRPVPGGGGRAVPTSPPGR